MKQLEEGFHVLPTEIVQHHIFLFFDTKFLKNSIALLSREYYEWVCETVQSILFDFEVQSVKSIIDCARIGSFRNIHTLVIRKIEQDRLGEIFIENNWKKLTSLTILGVILSAKDFENICSSLPQLSSLCLMKSILLNPDFCNDLEKLKDLKLLGLMVMKLADGWCEKFVKIAPKGLKSLYLALTKVNSSEVNMIGSLSTLESLRLDSTSKDLITESCNMWNMPSLTYLNMDRRNFSKAMLDVCKLTTLKTLSMSNCSMNDESSWGLLSSTLFPNLTSLDASHNTLSISWIKGTAPNLTSLNLNSCGINDIDIIQLFSGMAPKLEVLDISDNKVTDEGISTISHSPFSQRLRSLTLISNSTIRLTDLSLEHISTSPYLENLTCINLSGNQITSVGLLQLGQSNLKDLKLSKTRITGSSIRKFINFGKNK